MIKYLLRFSSKMYFTSVLLEFNFVFRSYSEADMPGSVPAYDPTEQQLLASIEREMGVLY